jgi:VWFA-related protein
MLAWMRRLAAMLLVFVASAAHAQFGERIDVVRILLDIRVTNINGDAIANLKPADFDVRVGGKRAEVEAVEWVDESSSLLVDESSSPTQPLDDSTTRRLGRLFVIFVQTDFARNNVRVAGQMGFLPFAEKLLDSFHPDDRIAVLQFDSHLKLRLDFTNDKEDVMNALKASLRIDQPPQPPIVPEPSLASRLNREDMKKAADSEAGLLVVGNALRSIPGPKTLLLLGWGLGRLSGGAVHMTKTYQYAREALDAARTAIFTIDVPHVDYHDLELGLQRAAEDTGGLYVKTYRFPQIAIERLQRTLAGHYEITLVRPKELKNGVHDLVVRVKRRGAVVLAPTSFKDRQ